MPQSNSFAAAPGGVATTPPSLGQAITALRRGEPVLIRDDLICVLAVAAELVNE